MATGVLPRAARSEASRPAGVTPRIASLDFVRGMAMILMAIDHVRVYSGLPAGGPTPGIFFTRWVTHFCAPVFVFLTGTAASLHARKLGSPAALSKFLFTRGLWLIFLELTFLRLAWTFNFDYQHYMLAGVIWMIGWCMVILAVVVRLPVTAVAASGIAIMVLHNLADVFHIAQKFGGDGPNWLLKILYFSGGVELGKDGPPLLILFVLVPWIGVMMAGYGFGTVMNMPPDRRRAICFQFGAALAIGFIVLRAVNSYGDPRPWRSGGPMPAILSFLNTTKYPASLDFLLMTLGPMFLLLALAEAWHGPVARAVTTFGRVPMFYYLLHIPVIHAAACMVSLMREGRIEAWLFANHPLNPGRAPAGYTWTLGLLYAVYALCLVVLYFPCRWFARVRATRKSTWLSYL